MKKSEQYEIELPVFKGPFDLLLFFIQRDELDIYDIPISSITHDFLDYIHSMQEKNIELASEFILVAATLMKIKAQMLLPRKELDEAGVEIDPRDEIVQKILEYKQYKELSEQLIELESIAYTQIPRMGAEQEFREIAAMYQTDYEMEQLTMNRLLNTFTAMLRKRQETENTQYHLVQKMHYDIEDEKAAIIKKLSLCDKLSFETLFDTITDRIHAIYHFLAMLELVQEQKVRLILGDGVNSFWIQSAELMETSK